jgi:hypothetical protein
VQIGGHPYTGDQGEFQMKLEVGGEDLFTQVANEYIKQLNREIKAVYAEMKHTD